VLLDFDPVNGAGGNGHTAAHDGFVGIDAGACAVNGHLVVLQDALVVFRRLIIAIDDIVVIALGGNAESDVVSQLIHTINRLSACFNIYTALSVTT